MAVLVLNPAKYKVCTVICFLHAKGEIAAEINHQLVSVYGENVMNRQNIAKWCYEFQEGRCEVHDKIHVEGHPLSLIKSSKKTEEMIWINRLDDPNQPLMNFMNNVQKCQELFFMKWLKTE